MIKLSPREKKPFLYPSVTEDLFGQIFDLDGFSKKTNTYIDGGLKFDFNYGIAYSNGHIAFRVVSGTPLLVKDLLGGKKDLKKIKKILDVLKIKPREIECKYGLCRINEEIRDLVNQKNSIKLGKDTLKKRSLLNNQISFLRQIGSLCSIQDNIDTLRSPCFRPKIESEKVLPENDLKVKRIKKLIGI